MEPGGGGHKHSYAVDFHYLAQIERKSLKFLMKKLFSFVSGSVIAIAITISIVISVDIVIFDIVVIVVAALIFYLNFVFCLHFLATCSHIVNNKPRQSELSWAEQSRSGVGALPGASLPVHSLPLAFAADLAHDLLER